MSTQANLIIELEQKLHIAQRQNEALYQACEAWESWVRAGGPMATEGMYPLPDTDAIKLTHFALGLVRQEEKRASIRDALTAALDELKKGTTSGRGGFSRFENERCQKMIRDALKWTEL